MLSNDDLLGLEESVAIKLLKDSNSSFRITKRDNQHYIVTRDFKPERFNLEIKDALIVKVTKG